MFLHEILICSLCLHLTAFFMAPPNILNFSPPYKNYFGFAANINFNDLFNLF
jgi:hypothetical protein